MTHFHLDVFVPKAVPSGSQLKVTIKDFGPNGVDGVDDKTQSFTISTSELKSDGWSSFDVSFDYHHGQNLVN